MATQAIEKERMKSLRLFKYVSPRICQNTLFSTLGSGCLYSMKILFTGTLFQWPQLGHCILRFAFRIILNPSARS